MTSPDSAASPETEQPEPQIGRDDESVAAAAPPARKRWHSTDDLDPVRRLFEARGSCSQTDWKER